MSLPEDYAERVYAGVLGKIIGVYLGRPFEGWTYERIRQELGDVEYYVNHRLAAQPPLVVTDDDISGTFTFLRALPDYANTAALTPAQIGQTWLNYIVEDRTILWWGGLGVSTEHTAYLRLKNGMKAPASGATATNGKIIAEQIGAQIFVDGWAMVAPGDPALAADLAARAASVSHDGEAVYAAQVLAAMEAHAFVEPDINRLLDVGTSFIPRDSVIYRLIADVRRWHAAEPEWRAGRRQLVSRYNYDNFGGNCHVVPNHGLIILALLYGAGDFNRSLSIVNTAGWDTDCNSGNLGCLLGIKEGLAAFDHGKDWRGPVADRLYLPTADGGRAITDAVREAGHIVNTGRSLAGLKPLVPKSGARFHFEFPGSVQGFQPGESTTGLTNVAGHSQQGQRSLKITFAGTGSVSTPTFILPDEATMPGYQLLASPTLYPGQTARAGFTVEKPAEVQFVVSVYDHADRLVPVPGPEATVEANSYTEMEWLLPDTQGQPIAAIGLICRGESGPLYLDYLSWTREPDVLLTRPAGSQRPADPPQMWRRAWVDAADRWESWTPEPFRLVHNSGRGLIIQGTRQWQNYQVEADVKTWLMRAGGIAARVQGLKRFYALQLAEGDKVRLLKALDGDTILAESHFPWEHDRSYVLKLQVHDNRITAWVDGRLQFDVVDEGPPLSGGAVAYVVDDGHISSQAMRVQPGVHSPDFRAT